ncbi:MAG: hypothetical protein OXR73_03115, partial [Myxococcales bacterium]|nr:hypothetical protein [Myxococcales bacterium]
MQASHGLAVMLFLALIALSLACSDNPSSPAPVLPALDASVEVDPLAQTWGEINLECPETTRPLTGRGAKRGPCCYRGEPNSVRVDAYGDGPESVIEYRANYLVQTNHPDSLSLMALVNTAIERSDHEEQSLLIRFVTARMDGAQASGPGSITLGQGRYNCDGTYSFYANDAAPTGGDFPGADDPSRWAPKVVPITVDASKQGRESATIAFADNYNGRAYTPFVHSGTYEYEWELVTQGFNIRNLGTDREDLDCQGRRNGGMWEPGVDTEAYVVLSDNHHKSNGIPLLQGQTFSQPLAFG